MTKYQHPACTYNICNKAQKILVTRYIRKIRIYLSIIRIRVIIIQKKLCKGSYINYVTPFLIIFNTPEPHNP